MRSWMKMFFVLCLLGAAVTWAAPAAMAGQLRLLPAIAAPVAAMPSNTRRRWALNCAESLIYSVVFT